MSDNNKNIVQTPENEEQNSVFNPSDDLQIVMQGGLPVSVIVPMEEFDKMTCIIELAEELLEGKDLFLPDGTKTTFQEMAETRVAAERAEYEAELEAMFEEEEEEDCDEDCDDNCDTDEEKQA